MAQNNWQLNRAGVLNFWYYDEEEFYFADGKLLLRGSNGSGKSVTMQSLIPVLLDGRKSPDRLDPFGSRARRMEDYLLGEKDVVERDERTGYLYLEFKRRQTEQYLTIGMGLRARRNSSMDSWGFIVLDNRRIGRDFNLYKSEYSAEDGKKQKIPLTRRELENKLQSGGRVVRSQSEYMELVNKYIFGFKSTEAYKELIELLIQLRSPKLSKDFKPTVVYDILNQSLPPLTDEELRPLSDTIENMDQIKQQLEQLQRDRNSLQKLCRSYDFYNRYILTEKARGLLNTEARRRKLEEQKKQLLVDLEQYRLAGQEAAQKMASVEREKEVLSGEEQKLRQHDVFRAEAEKQELLERMRVTRQNFRQKEQSLEQKRGKEWDLQQNIHNEEHRLGQYQKEMQEILQQLEVEAREAGFAAHQQAASEFQRYLQTNYQFDLWQKETGDYRQWLEQVLITLREYAEVRRRFQEADFELAEVRKELDYKRNQEKKHQDCFEAQKQQLLEAVYLWLEANNELRLETEEIQLLARNLQQLYEPYAFEQARQPVENAYRRHLEVLSQELVRQKHRLEEKEAQIKAKEEEVQHWKSLKEPEPERHPDTVAARQFLLARGIAHLPFFAAVEFKDEVQPQQRERIEAAIKEMGLLDALIVPAKDLHKVNNADKVIIPCPQVLGYSLADFLYPTPVDGVDVSAADISNVLHSVMLDFSGQGQTGILEDGSYRIGLLQGQAPSQERAIYIGREARQKYRRQVLARLEEELAELEAEWQDLQAAREQGEQRLKQLRQEYESFPPAEAARESYDIYEKSRREVQIWERESERQNEKVKQLLEQMQLVRARLRELEQDAILESNIEVYQAAVQHMEAYAGYLHRLELTFKEYQNGQKLLEHYRQNWQEIVDDVDGLKGELNLLAAAVDKLEQQLQQVELRLQKMGVMDIRQRIEEIMQRLQEIEAALKELPRRIERSENKAQVIEQDLARVEQDLQLARWLVEAWQQVFRQEDCLGFVEPARLGATATAEEVLARAQTIARQYDTLLQQNERDKVKDRLSHSYYQEQAVLVEYRPSLEDMPASFEQLPPAGADETAALYLEELKQKAGRTQLLLEYDGKRVSPYYLLQQMESDIELQKLTLNEKDRQLYQEIIMNNVGRVIRERIGRAEQWVQKIDSLMRQRDTSSGLTFSLRWKPHLAEDEEELDTGELVELLRSDPRLLMEADLNRITRHFQARIGRAKELLAGRGSGETLHQVIKQVLDYRQWFSFTLYYQREGESKKELTNNVFYRFSGGEKAMAMYIPLFSAAYSRYLEASDDAPYIISLDEAFAGVDENNIRDMFALMEQLGFNYIINSQSLWGDYDTVAALSIVELVRPKNAPFVSLIHYHWDGQVRELLDSTAATREQLLAAAGR